MAFQHRMQAILRIRQNERDLQQQSVVAARDCHALLVAEQGRLAKDRVAILKTLRRLNDGEGLDVGQVLNLRRHAEQLVQELAISQANIVKAEADLRSCLAHLVVASQSVRVLERLVERQTAEHEASVAKAAAREFDDVTISNWLRAS